MADSGRVVALVTVKGGYVFAVTPGDENHDTWEEATYVAVSTPPLAATGVVRSALNGGKLFFADGTNEVYWQASDNTVRRWTATRGTLPGHGANKPRLIETWRGRTVVSGILSDGQNWHMSKVSDPFDWDYNPGSPSPDQAIAGNNSPLGLIGDMVTCLIPFSDDVLIMGGDHTVWLFNGDPMAGGQIDLVTDAVGMAWGKPWCKDPQGVVYFFANRPAVYSLVPGQQPQRISQPVESLLQSVDTEGSTIRLVWNDRLQGLHVFISTTDGAAAATHYFWEQRTGAWWQDTFASNNFNPLACCVFDGSAAADRVALLGSWDGYVRSVSPTATTDDGSNISSSVWIGPLLTADMDDLLLKDLQAILGTASGDVTYSVHVGNSAQAAYAASASVTGTWGAGRNLDSLVRRSGHAVYVKITSTNAWALEQIRARIAGKGKVRRRGI